MTRRKALITVLVTVAIAWGSLAATLAAGITPRLGLDLQGGFEVLLEAPAGTDRDVLEKAVEIMRDRIEALGNVQEPEIAVAGDRNVVVQLPGVTDRSRALAAVGTTGQLEFRPVLDIGAVSPLLIAAGSVDDQGNFVPGEITLPDGISFCDPDELLISQPGCVDEATGVTLSSNPDLEGWFLSDETGLVYHTGPARLLGGDLSNADARFQSSGGIGPSGGSLGGEWVVLLELNSEGDRRFTEVTKELASFPLGDPRRQFAIVLDNSVVSAPQIAAEVDPNEGISGGTAIITVGSSGEQEREATDLAVVLKYGALPVAFEQPSVRSVSATLGSDSLTAGLVAGIGGLLLVAIAMILYYRALGLVNVIGLTVFGSIMLVAYSLLGETQGVTLTLAGVAGLIVSVGITSDSYIVYFERIKEEVHKGRSVRSAVDHAFARSFRTILTADTVSFAGAILLFLLAIGGVKGFALALGLSTVTDVIVAYFFTRPAVALVARTRLGEGGAFSLRGATGEATEVPA